MAGSGYIQVPPDSTGKQVDMVSATVGGVSVARQVFALANAADGQTIAEVVAASASTGAVGVVVRPTTATVALVTGSTVGINSIGTVTVDGTVNISSMPAVGVSIGAVAISGTAIVAGVVGLTAGTAVIGDLNAISRTVQVAVGTPFTLQGISTTVNVAIATPYILQGISTTVATVTNITGISAGVTIGINSISATVNVRGIVSLTGTGVSVISGFYPNSAGATNTIQVADSANSALRVNVVAGSAGGPSMVDDTSFSAGAANVTPIGGVFFGGVSSLSASHGGALAATSARALHVNLRDSAGNELSAGTATVVGNVSLVAGTANIGFLDSISKTVVTVCSGFYANSAGATNTIQVGDSANTAIRVNVVAGGTGGGLVSVTGTVIVAVSTPFTLQGISTTVQVAVGTPFILQGISTTVATVTNITAISAGVSIAINAISAGVTIGVNSISATVNVAGQVRLNPAPAIMSASRGPKCVTASTSANVTLIASPGAGANIYVTKVFCSNASGTGFAMRVGTSASIQTVVGFAASSGGGFVVDFGDMPWMLSASEAAVCSVKPNGSYGLFNVHYYVI